MAVRQGIDNRSCVSEFGRTLNLGKTVFDWHPGDTTGDI